MAAGRFALRADAQAQRTLDLARFGGHLGERRTATDEERATADLGNRAATYLWTARAEIRSAGTYAFRSDPSVLPLLRSAYRHRHRSVGKSTPTTG